MTVDVVNSKVKKVRFQDLKVGDTFYDCDADLAIKTDIGDCSNGIYYNGREWFHTTYDFDSEVAPVNSVLKVGTDT